MAAVYHTTGFSSRISIIFIFPNFFYRQGILHLRNQKDCLRGTFGDVRGLTFLSFKRRQFLQSIHHIDRINVDVQFSRQFRTGVPHQTLYRSQWDSRHRQHRPKGLAKRMNVQAAPSVLAVTSTFPSGEKVTDRVAGAGVTEAPGSPVISRVTVVPAFNVCSSLSDSTSQI
jgi:hypothetical protein